MLAGEEDLLSIADIRSSFLTRSSRKHRIPSPSRAATETQIYKTKFDSCTCFFKNLDLLFKKTHTLWHQWKTEAAHGNPSSDTRERAANFDRGNDRGKPVLAELDLRDTFLNVRHLVALVG